MIGYQGVYSARVNLTAFTGAKTAMQIKAGASNPLEILRVSITQRGGTTSEQIQAQLLRKTAAATVTSLTPLKMDPSAPTAGAAGGTAATGTNASGEGTDGDVLIQEGFNVLNGFLYLPVPEERIKVPAGGIFAVKFPDAITSGTYNVVVIFGEI